MRSRFDLRLSWAAAAILAAAAFVWPLRATPSRRGLGSQTGWARPLAEVPAGLRASLGDQGRSMDLVSVIAADIDADGDLDIVASDSKLDLFVWVNDGDGHLSQQQVRRRTSVAPEPAPPTLEQHAGAGGVSLQNEPPTVHVDMRASFEGCAPEAFSPRPAARALVASSISTRVPRAPPATLPI